MFTNFEVETARIKRITAYFADRLPLADDIVLGNENAAVMCIGTEIGVIMLENDELTITPQTAASIHDCATAGCFYRRSLGRVYIDSLENLGGIVFTADSASDR